MTLDRKTAAPLVRVFASGAAAALAIMPPPQAAIMPPAELRPNARPAEVRAPKRR